MDANLRVCSGCIGQPRLVEGKTSEHIARATVKALKLFCTPGFGGSVDEALLSHVRSHVHIMVTDAASAELLASDILRSRRRSDQAELQRHVFFPNIVLLGRDASHACMRLLKRPWHVMDDVKDAVSSTVTNKESLAQKGFPLPELFILAARSHCQRCRPPDQQLIGGKAPLRVLCQTSWEILFEYETDI